MNELDSSRLSLAKAISDAETLLANREAELSVVKEEARRLELYDPASEHEKELDGSALVFDTNINVECPLMNSRISLGYGWRFSKD